jgi:peptidoglycan/xylan/chitin deacetylase (PgdA/CDA1 family)
VRLWIAPFVCAAACESTPVVLYHHVGEEADPPRWVSSELFAAQMDYLIDQGFTAVTASELDAIEDGDRPPPERAVVLTFDDGYRDFYVHAFPILRERGLSATMFLVAGWVGDSEATRKTDPVPYLIWPEVREMMGHGVEFQSHSLTHPRFDEITIDQARVELVESKRIIEEHTGAPVTVLAYPFGVSSGDVRALAAEVGYSSAHSVIRALDGRHNRLCSSVHHDTSVQRLAEMLGGSWWGQSSGVR